MRLARQETVQGLKNMVVEMAKEEVRREVEQLHAMKDMVTQRRQDIARKLDKLKPG